MIDLTSTKRVTRLIVALFCMLGTIPPTRAEKLFATVRNGQGEAVKDAVIYAQPLNSLEDGRSAFGPIQIDQINKEFVPYVTALRVGTDVNFPNRDQIRHHVYSFSEAKTFEIPLYKGTPAKPITFNKPGEVVLGCNIHDWMKAYVFVSNTPYYAVTGIDGKASLDLPPGEYRVEVWHPTLKGPSDSTARQHRVGAGENSQLDFSIEQKPVWKPRRAPAFGDPDYR